MTTYLDKANRAALEVPRVLANRGLEPHISRAYLVESKGRAWLFIILDQHKIAKIERYTDSALIHQMSTALGGLPVIVSNSTGLRYAILLSDPPRLPASTPWPGYQSGLVQIGVNHAGPVQTTWQGFGHALAAGMTRSGKSNFLRLVTLQALLDGHQVILIDPDGQTYPESIVGHPGTLAHLAGPYSVMEGVSLAQDIYTERQQHGQTEGPRVLLVIDEYNGLTLANGGAKGIMAQSVTGLAYGALKFGIHIVLAGHEWTRDLVGPISGQMTTRLCFRVKVPSTSRVVIGQAGAERITRPGRALSDPWGWLQVYPMELADLAALLQVESGSRSLSQQDQAIWDLAQQAGGRLTYEVLKAAGLSRSQADKTRQAWLSRGLVRYDPDNFNSLALVQDEAIPA